MRRVLLAATLLLASALPLAAQNGPQPQADMQPCSKLSSVKVHYPVEALDPATQRLVNRGHLPMRVDVGRYNQLRKALAGYMMTGVPLTAYDGERLLAAGSSDDVGVFYFVPALARLLHLGLDGGIYLFFSIALAAALISGITGLMLLVSGRRNRTIAIVGVVAIVAIGYVLGGDIYMVPFIVPLMLVPWALYFNRSASMRGRWLFIAVAGLVIGTAIFIRLDAALPTFAFVLCLAALGYPVSSKSRVALIALLLAGILLPRAFFRHEIRQRDAFLARATANYEPPNGHHVIWHDVYIGFGFLSNPYVAGYCDEVAIAAVHETAPTAEYGTPLYGAIIRQKVFDLIRRDPAFASYVIFSKIAVTALMVLLCANIGLLAAIRHPKPWPIELAFWTAIALAAVAGVLTVPLPKYTIGLMTLAVLYGVMSLAHLPDRTVILNPRRRIFHKLSGPSKMNTVYSGSRSTSPAVRNERTK